LQSSLISPHRYNQQRQKRPKYQYEMNYDGHLVVRSARHPKLNGEM
jgi:hypothetical protein